MLNLFPKPIGSSLSATSFSISISDAFSFVTCGSFSKEQLSRNFAVHISSIRKDQLEMSSSTDHKRKSELKKNIRKSKEGLPSLTVGNSRLLDELTEWGGYAQVDLDHLDNPESISDAKRVLSELTYIALVFTSPTGTGVKAFAHCSPCPDGTSLVKHMLAANRTLSARLLEVGLVQDPAVAKNPVQMCFMSHDPEAFLREDTIPLDVDYTLTDPVPEEPDEISLPAEKDESGRLKLSEKDTKNIIRKVIKREMAKVLEWKDGEKDNKILTLGNRLGHLVNGGLALEDADLKPLANAILTVIQRDNGDTDKAQTTLMKGFENGKRGDIDEDAASLSKLLPKASRKTNPDEGVDLPFKWWDTVEYDDRVSTSLDMPALADWLIEEGFGRFQLHTHEVVLCRLVKNILDDSSDLFDNLGAWVLNQVETRLPEPTRSNVREAIYDMTRVNPLFTKNHFALWPIQKLPDPRPPVGTIRLFFLDGVVEIEGGVKFLPYDKFDGIVPVSSMIPFKHAGNFNPHEATVWPEFCRCVCTHPTDERKVYAGAPCKSQQMDRYKALLWAMGFMLDSHRQCYSAVCFTEANEGDGAEGRAGKGILTKAFHRLFPSPSAYVSKACRDESSLAHKNALSKVTHATRVLLLDDLPQNFNFNSVFNLITDDWDVGKYGKDSLGISSDRAPKIMLTSNFAIRGTDGSTLARRTDIELTRFFNAGFTPLDYFGNKGMMWGASWDENDWRGFYNFFVMSARVYLSSPHAAPKYVSQTLTQRMEQLEVPERYRDMLDEKLIPLIEKHESYEKTGFLTISNAKVSEWEREYVDKFQMHSGKRRRYFSFYLKGRYTVECTTNIREGNTRGRGLVLIPLKKLETGGLSD